MGSRRQKKEEAIGREIVKYGEMILRSPQFQSGFSQTHHYITTVGDHTLNVTIVSVKLAHFFEKKRGTLDLRSLIHGALLHDLGIIGRAEKYRNNHECGQRHASDSVSEARKLLPELTPKLTDIIENHMFPVTPTPPSSEEGTIVVTADKYCALIEWIFFLLRMEPYHYAKQAIRDELGRDCP